MGAPEGRDPGGRHGPAIRRAAVLAWAACAVVVWNVVFDAIVKQAGRDYLTLQALHQQGKAPAVTIRGVMDPGVARAAREATLAGGVIGAAGLITAWLAGRPRQRASAGRPQ